MKESRKILICPLEWGLGHAGRMIPLALRLHELGNQIIAGSGKEQLAFLRTELPFAETIYFPGFRPGYSRFLPQYLALLFRTPALLYHIIREHYILKRIIEEKEIDIVISDNRFGLWNKKITTVYITHQLQIPFPEAFSFLEPAGRMLHRVIIKKYDYCFVPDLPGELNLSGRLSHFPGIPGNVRFIGILSRFSSVKQEAEQIPEPGGHDTVILSGPEPQKSILKVKLAEIMDRRDKSAIFLEGRPGDDNKTVNEGKLTFISHPLTGTMSGIIRSTDNIISRSGYTTIMELVSVRRSALLIPTPGQTEQEYLARYLSERGWFTTTTQKNLTTDLKFPVSEPSWPEEINSESRRLLELALNELLSEKQQHYYGSCKSD